MFVVKSREYQPAQYPAIIKLIGSTRQDVGYVMKCQSPAPASDITGNPANPELIQIPAGQLYLVRPNSIKGSRECIFKDAVATIRRTGIEHQYQLVVTRAYEEGEEQLLDDDAESTSFHSDQRKSSSSLQRMMSVYSS